MSWRLPPYHDQEVTWSTLHDGCSQQPAEIALRSWHCRCASLDVLQWHASSKTLLIIAEANADEEDNWLLDSKPLWQQMIKYATRLAAQCKEFRGALKKDPRIQQCLADSRGATQPQIDVKELSPLLTVLTGS